MAKTIDDYKRDWAAAKAGQCSDSDSKCSPYGDKTRFTSY